MRINVFFTCVDMFRISVVSEISAHFFSIIHHHLIMKALNLFYCMNAIQLLNIKITQAKCLFHLHSILFTESGYHCGSDNKMIFHICDRIL